MAGARKKFYITESRLKVLRVLRDAKKPLYGAEITKATGLAHGTVYPILKRFKEQRWVVSAVKPGPHPAPPSRVYYRITSKGRKEAAIHLKYRDGCST